VKRGPSGSPHFYSHQSVSGRCKRRNAHSPPLIGRLHRVSSLPYVPIKFLQECVNVSILIVLHHGTPSPRASPRVFHQISISILYLVIQMTQECGPYSIIQPRRLGVCPLHEPLSHSKRYVIALPLLLLLRSNASSGNVHPPSAKFASRILIGQP